MNRFIQSSSRLSFGMLSVGTALLALSVGGCPTPGGDGNSNGNSNSSGNSNSNNSNSSNSGSFNPILTNAVRDSGGDIQVGDDIIAIGTRNESGVQYLIPSQGDTDPKNISNFEEFVPSGFGVAGNWIIARNFDGEVGLFNGDTEQLIMVPESDLAHIAGAAPSREFWTDGDYCVTIADANRVSDGLSVKVIDFTGNAPVIKSYPQPNVTQTPGRENETWQADIDATARRIVVQVTDWLLVYDLDDPNAQPQGWNLQNFNGIRNTRNIHLSGDYVIYQTFDKTGNGREVTRIINITNGTLTQLPVNPSADLPLAFEAGKFGYFAFETDADMGTNGTSRAVLGEIQGDTPDITFENDARNAIGDDPDDGIVGYGCTICITPNGEYTFVAGCGIINVADYFMYSTGGAFKTLDDEFDQDSLNSKMLGSEVHASNTLVAWETPDGVAYSRIP